MFKAGQAVLTPSGVVASVVSDDGVYCVVNEPFEDVFEGKTNVVAWCEHVSYVSKSLLPHEE